MARRVSWTNNSSGHSGTYVYRAPTLDPQNLPAPVATVDPVAQGATAEWVDNESLATGDYDYAVQDFDGSEDGALSAVVTHSVEASLDTAQIGDEIGGGIYAGTITYADSREFHIIFAKQDGESALLAWGNSGTTTGADDPDDGMANQEEVLTNHDDGSADAFYHCRDYVDADGNSDYYLPARNELALSDALVSMSHAEFSTNLTTYRWASTESSSDVVWVRRFSDGNEGDFGIKFNTDVLARPVRRVPV